MKPGFTTIFVTLLFLSSCKKESNNEYCWQLVDGMGNNRDAVCNRTLAEMQADYPNPCTYYRLGGEEYCWLIGSNTPVKNATQNKINQVIQCFYNGSVQAVKVACDYCQPWNTRQKNTYKQNNAVFYSPVRAEQYCGDTVRTLFRGRQVILRETADSLIVLQFSNNGIF